MGLLVDSGLLIAAERGRVQLHQVISNRWDEPLAISVITASELLHGIHRASTPEQADKRRQFVEFVLSLFPVIAIELEVARCHARIWAELQVRGQLIGAHDLLIAATAIATQYDLLTLNVNEFSRVQGLTVINPLEG